MCKALVKSSPPTNQHPAGCPDCHPTNSVRALSSLLTYINKQNSDNSCNRIMTNMLHTAALHDTAIKARDRTKQTLPHVQHSYKNAQQSCPIHTQKPHEMTRTKPRGKQILEIAEGTKLSSKTLASSSFTFSIMVNHTGVEYLSVAIISKHNVAVRQNNTPVSERKIH